MRRTIRCNAAVERSRRTNSTATARGGIALLAALTVALVTGTTPAGADPTRTPATAISADGRSATDGVRTLTVSQSHGLSQSGQHVRVTGSGYDANKGIYVALCVIPPPNVLPTPCGGGVDIEGQAGASHWISSNPPSYGIGLARPYGPGGTFDTTFTVSPTINASVDCRFVRCGLLTRNDHTRSADRSQDVIIPVSFTQPASPGAPLPAPPPADGPGGTAAPPPGVTPAPPPPAPPTAPPSPPASSTTTTTSTPPAPEVAINDDGTEASDGTRTLRVERAAELDEEGDVVVVEGSGFDTTRGVYLALCGAEGQSDAAPVPCATGDERSIWLSNDPPEWGLDLARPFDEDGSFRVELAVDPAIDDTTDCTEVECAITVRADDTAAGDRSLDLALPVSFVKVDDTEVDVATAAVDDDDEADELATAPITDDSSDTALPWVVVGAVLAALLAAGAGLWLRRRDATDTVAGSGSGEGPDSTVGVT